MADNRVLVESADAALLSEIGKSSAKMMKDAYLPLSGKNSDNNICVTGSQPANTCPDNNLSGPDATVTVTKISTKTSRQEIIHFLNKDPGQKESLSNYDFYTVVIITSIRMDDPANTHFINATIEFSFPPGIKILDYSPKERGIVTGIINSGGTGISISRTHEFLALLSQTEKEPSSHPENQFEIRVGPEEKISGSYSKKSGYSLQIPPSWLLEYMVMQKNEHEVYGEIYPPMPLSDKESTGKENLAVFSFIIQVPRKSSPEILVRMEGRVKGNLWGVIPLKGSVALTNGCNVS